MLHYHIEAHYPAALSSEQTVHLRISTVWSVLQYGTRYWAFGAHITVSWSTILKRTLGFEPFVQHQDYKPTRLLLGMECVSIWLVCPIVTWLYATCSDRLLPIFTQPSDQLHPFGICTFQERILWIPIFRTDYLPYWNTLGQESNLHQVRITTPPRHTVSLTQCVSIWW